MAFRITDTIKQYQRSLAGSDIEENEMLQEQLQQNFEERVAAKVETLKDLYYSDTEKYSKFAEFTDEDWEDYAKVCLKNASALNLKNTLQNLPSVTNDPEMAKWVQFTYEEILQMESTGVLIPKEVLEWAHSMQDSDVTSYEINEDPNAVQETEETGTNSDQSELQEMQKKAITLSNKTETTQTQLNQDFESFEEIARKAEQIKKEQETTKNDTMQQIADLTKEWEDISAKIKNGEKLTESEQNRYKELGSMLNGKDGELVTSIQASSDDLQELINSMDGLNIKIQDGIELGDETVELAKQLSLYEKGYIRKNTDSRNTTDVSTGEIRNLLAGSLGKDIAQDALDSGNNLIEFSNTLSDQLMMNQYASLYDFAEIFTQTSTETISNTKEVLGEDFNKTTEEINEKVDALPDMTNAEKEHAGLEENGVGLVGQALYFAKKSKGETLKSILSMIQLGLVERQTQQESNRSQKLTEILVNTMDSKKEEADKLTEKKEKAEEQKQAANDAVKAAEEYGQVANTEETSETGEEEFTEKDQQRLDKLNNQLERTGNFGQQKLYQSLSKVDGYEKFIQSKPLDGTNAIDYGQVTQEVGRNLMEQMPPSFIMVFLKAIGAMAYAAGKISEEIGNENNDSFDETTETTSSAKSSISQNQISIQQTTSVNAITPVSTTQGENNSAQTENTETTNEAEQTAEASSAQTNSENNEFTKTHVTTTANTNSENIQDTLQESNNAVFNTDNMTGQNVQTGAATNIDQTQSGQTQTEENTIKTGSNNEPSENMSPAKAATEGKAQQKAADESNDQVKNAQTEAKDAQKESQNVKKDSEKTEKQLETELKNTKKLIEKDTQDIEKLAEDSKKAQQEQLALAAEFEVLNTQNEEIAAKQQAKQNQTVSAAPANPQEGGLLAPKQPQIVSSSDSADIATFDANNIRLQAISGRFTALGTRITNNNTKIYQKSSSIRSRSKKYEKIAKARLKIQQAAQKKEQEKQKRIQIASAAIDLCNSVFGVVSAVGNIIGLVGKNLIIAGTAMIASGTSIAATGFGAVAGAALIASGTIMVSTGTPLEATGETLNIVGVAGVASCGVAKASISAANGDIQGALMTLGTTIVSIATVFIPGGGQAAQAGIQSASQAVVNGTQTALQITSQSLSIVSSTANAAGSAQTLAGKEKSEWLNTVSQVAGIGASLTGVASGFTGGGNKGGGAQAKNAIKFEDVIKVAQAVGTTVSSAAQMSAIIKQAMGEEPGKLENILNTIGYSISAAASLAQVGVQIKNAAQNKKELKSSNNSQEADDQKAKDDIVDNSKSKNKTSKKDNKNKSTDKVEDNQSSDNQGDNNSGNVNLDNSSSTVTDSDQNVADMEAQAQEAVESVENSENVIDDGTSEEIQQAQTGSSEEEQAIQQAEEAQKQNAEQDNKKLSAQERREARQAERAQKREDRLAEKQARQEARAAKKSGAATDEEEMSLEELYKKSLKESDQKYQQATEQMDQNVAEKWIETAINNGSVIIENEQGIKIEIKCDGKNFTCNGQTFTQEEINEILKTPDVLFTGNDNKTALNTTNTIVDENAPTETDEIPTANVNDKPETTESSIEEKTEVQAASESNTNSEQEPDESSSNTIVKQEETPQIEIVAEKAGIAVGESVNIGGTAYEITSDGRFLIGGKETTMAEFMNSVKNSGYINKNVIDDMKAQLDEEMKRALSAEKSEFKKPDELSTDNSEKRLRQEKMDKALEITSAVVSGGSEVMQTISSINELLNSQSEDENPTISLADLRKAKALMKKIRRRTGAIYGYAGR